MGEFRKTDRAIARGPNGKSRTAIAAFAAWTLVMALLAVVNTSGASADHIPGHTDGTTDGVLDPTLGPDQVTFTLEGCRGENLPAGYPLEAFDFLCDQEAVIALEHAHRQCPDDARILSFLGLALLLGSRPGRGAIKMCEQAVGLHEYDPDLLHNLGHAYLLSGNRRMAFEALSEACALDLDHNGVRQTLQRMGQRKPPVFGFLHRDNPLNIFAGKMFMRFGWR